ncbi:DUF2093 domain-containing protein [Parerythrobacter jejuensis]|uniref:DUF2093 domain-containing protein n=1 Tax=Parerythrobacter jejuensis TaxID=795812 RepID=A0A845AP91_9SPHN|nr:DUF2093 domain-containing protein [Parerythrobacter jejuensis]MXP31003.1 DUF2093 domain-containing protein [Parerythrobacter jejuensis]MXP33763.1 DUF2093 domain-containing protein [Parerythrobacter jejuensis]
MLMSSRDEPAKLQYGPNDFRVLRAGRFVHCAVSGEPILLEDLRYWSAELQEPYASAEHATRRLTGEA